MRIKITKTGIFGATGEVAIGSEFDVKAEPVEWAGKYEVISDRPYRARTAVTNPAVGAAPIDAAAVSGDETQSIDDASEA